jgi:hypothetical protein
MDKSLVYLIVGLAGLLFSALPFGVFMGLATQFELDINSSYLVVMLYTVTILFAFLSSMASYAAIQHQSCGSAKNMKQIAGNAGLTTVIIVLILSLAVFIPGLRSIVIDLFPPSTDKHISTAIGYAYFLFWAALYGFSTGGFMAANCGE